MLLAEAGCVFVGFILYLSGVQGRANRICALKGSSVDLPCSAQHPTSNMKWFTAHLNISKPVQIELSAETNRVTSNMSEKTYFTLTINDLRESDEKFYCCKESTDKPENCWHHRTELHVADLQVKVIPATEGQTVKLMCSTSCPLTENPAAYIWYRNREFLYQDWSPWYQQLVSSDKAVRYSCAIKGYEGLRAPEVSVDSVTPSCFSVTYAKGRMCSYKQTSVDEPCSITYPKEVHVQRTPAATPGHVILTCNTSCPLTSFKWYKNRHLDGNLEKPQQTVVSTSADSSSCAVKGREDLHSAEVCIEDNNCWCVNYVSSRICALEGSSVNISSKYSHPEKQQPKSKLWYKTQRSWTEEAEEPIKAAHRVEYYDVKNHHILRIKNLKKNDSAEYTFRLQKEPNGDWTQSDLPGVTLVVTEVTEGQRVTLTCSTSCPLTDNTNYIWYLNSRRLTGPETQNKHLVLEPVSSQQAGKYSCAVKTHNNSSSREKTLTVQSKPGKWSPAAAAGVFAALLVLIPLAVFLWIRRKRTSSQYPGTETSENNLEQINLGPMYDEISALPTEQDDLHYSTVHFGQNNTDTLYNTVQSHQPQEQEHIPYVVVNFRPNATPE
ncbi:uncharacterized protein LOC119898645 isoform X3 [Micropterus salmoides]|uniref:uncharacterized protein LOC119898645 isoform X3 n=1 Tax=Micropterus salmoides TaxID=27706 RepID=UPI0018EAE548|nr:uncharacterized protein LOC119898645 isoform X3 [Micropterus salmoides]